MSERLRILLADDESLRLLSLRAQLSELGFDVVGEAGTGVEAVRLARETNPDLIFLDIKMPEMDGITAAAAISKEQNVPIILLTAFSEAELVERAVEAGIFAYLVKPVAQGDLLPAIVLARARFAEFQSLREDYDDLREALQTRKIVERAKGILMDRRGLSETEAFEYLQRHATQQNKPIHEVADAVIQASKLL